MVNCNDCNFIDRENGPAWPKEQKLLAMAMHPVWGILRYRFRVDEVTLKFLSFNARCGEDFRIFLIHKDKLSTRTRSFSIKEKK